jgi:hypothetical protein
MVKNAQLLNTTRLRGFTAGTYGYAMPFAPAWNMCGVGSHMCAPITLVAQGISVPISGGGPPVLTE